MKKIIFCLLVIIFISGCSSEYFAKDKEHYSKFKNPNLDYNWDFNISLIGKDGKPESGYTFNSHYFQVKKYSLLQEILFLKFAYTITFKHEEGHIYQLQLLNINDIENEFYEVKCKFDRQYFISVTEGAADYYSITYFNNSLSDKYFKSIDDNKNDSVSGDKQHYQGYLFVNHTIAKGIYKNLREFTLDICNKNQYNLYKQYIKTLNI